MVVTRNILEEFFPFLSPLYRGAVGRAKELQLEIQQLFGKFVNEVRQDKKEGNERKCACNEFLKAQETDEEGHLYEAASKFGLGGCYRKKLCVVLVVYVTNDESLPHFNFLKSSTPAVHSSWPMMARHPEIQDRAFAEIKANIGLDRLPSDMDEASLPYTCAFITELLRFRPPTWLGIPHSNPKDEEYNGYHIP
ncbi:cytochrome P450 [Jimgerdemannia flammicorona]|uniref:Cytochrome P450 n=1 Tax=Jimgerdemannia flammicorona TaxID=994334 RepID=A0A433Q5W1_9FUNG|nr:cytochrome P450 [Jimgerdemannia flammicorona]